MADYVGFSGIQFNLWLQDQQGALANFVSDTGIRDFVTLLMVTCERQDADGNWLRYKHLKFLVKTPDNARTRLEACGYTVLDRLREEKRGVAVGLDSCSTHRLLALPIPTRQFPNFARNLNKNNILLFSMYSLSTEMYGQRIAAAFWDQRPNVYLNGSQFERVVDAIRDVESDIHEKLQRDFQDTFVFQVRVDANVSTFQDIQDILSSQSVAIRSVSIIKSGGKHIITFLPYSDQEMGLTKWELDSFERTYNLLSSVYGNSLETIPVLLFSIAGGEELHKVIGHLQNEDIALLMPVTPQSHLRDLVSVRFTCNDPTKANQIRDSLVWG